MEKLRNFLEKSSQNPGVKFRGKMKRRLQKEQSSEMKYKSLLQLEKCIQ